MSTTLPPWRPANCGNGKRIWFLCRYPGLDDESVPFRDRYHLDQNDDRLIRYASYATAKAAASRLNAAEARKRAVRALGNRAHVRKAWRQREPDLARAVETELTRYLTGASS